MNQLAKQNKLKSKFDKIEMDLEDERIGYQLPKHSLNNIQSSSQQMKSIRINNVIKVSKLAVTTTSEVIAFFYKSIIKSSVVFTSSKIKIVFNKMKEKEEETQIAVNRIIKASELQKTFEKEELQMHQLQKNKLLNSYYSQMETAFLSTIDSNHFEMTNHSDDVVKINMAQQMVVWSFISKKLIVSNMISNAKNIRISTTQKSNRLTTEMTIDMEKKGYLWSMMFGKHIVPELSNILKSSNGSLKIRHTDNLSKKTDQFILSMVSDVLMELPKVIKPEVTISKEADQKFMNDKMNNESVV